MLRQHESAVFLFLSAKKIHSITAALLAILLLTACQSHPPVQAVMMPRLLVVAHENPYLSLDPQERNDSVTWSVLGNIYEPLVEFDANLKITGRLAERWENPNDLTWRFYLRKKVRFHNGQPFSADDVVYTIKRAITGNRLGTRPYLISVKDVKSVDSYTVDIETDRPNPVLLNRLTFLFILPAAPSMTGTIQEPIGTGAYIFEKEEQPGKKLILRANPEYWNGKPAIQRVQFVHYENDSSVEALLKGEAQLIRDYSERLISKVEASRNCVALAHDGLGVAFLGFNLTGTPESNPLLKIQIRKAIQQAIDRSRLVAEALAGKANVAQQLVSPVIFGYDPSFPSAAYDIEGARKLLDQAGIPQTFRTAIYGNDEQRLFLLTDQVRHLNITVDARLVEWSELYDKLLKHEIPMYTLSWSCSTGDASDFLDSCVHSPDPEAGYGNFNVAGYRNAEVDRLIELSGQTLKANERKGYLQQALAITASDIPYIPLYSRYRHYGVSNDLSWQPRRDGRLYVRDMRWKQGQ